MKASGTSRHSLAGVVGDERFDLDPQSKGGRDMDRVERTQAGPAGRAGDAGEVPVELDERQQREQLMAGVGIGVGARHGLGHLDDRDPARYEAAAAHDILERARLELVNDQLGQRRGVQIDAAQRSSPRRSASSASVAVSPVMADLVSGSAEVSGFAGADTRPSSMRRARIDRDA